MQTSCKRVAKQRAQQSTTRLVSRKWKGNTCTPEEERIMLEVMRLSTLTLRGRGEGQVQRPRITNKAEATTTREHQPSDARGCTHERGEDDRHDDTTDVDDEVTGVKR